jgi:hypothetical protein
VTKDEKISESVRRAVETFKLHAAPVMLNEPAAITAYYAVFNSPAIWKPGTRTPQEMFAPAVKMTARFKRSFGS